MRVNIRFNDYKKELEELEVKRKQLIADFEEAKENTKKVFKRV